MSMVIDGNAGLTFPNSSTLSTELGIFNRIINGGFIINQRGNTSGTALSAGSYGHDRWKGGASGCTYTFTQGSTGVNTTITITAGTLQQVIEGCNVPEGGTYTLSWTGTATARVGSGSYSASPLTVTGITAGANTTVEFGTGTVGSVQFETGSYASGFAYRPYGTELALCQRYFQNWSPYNSTFLTCQCYAPTAFFGTIWQFAVQLRASPTVTYSGTWSTNNSSGSGVSINSTPTNTYADTKAVQVVWGGGSGLTAGNATVPQASISTSTISASAEL